MALLTTGCLVDETLLLVALRPELIRCMVLGCVTMQGVEVNLKASTPRNALTCTKLDISCSLAVVADGHRWIESHSLHHATLLVCKLHALNIDRLAQLAGRLIFYQVALLDELNALNHLVNSLGF